MVDIINRRCPLCISHIDSRVGNVKYDWHCATCFKRAFPDDPRSKVVRGHTKEIRVRNFLMERYGPGFIHDKALYVSACDCTHKRRVDHRMLVGGVMLAIETDEFAHRGYDAKDEEIRYDDLFMIHSGQWIFIRFNPDENKASGKGIDFDDKLERLAEEIDKHMERIKNCEYDFENEPVEIYYLFY
jgi:hypothetical protein